MKKLIGLNESLQNKLYAAQVETSNLRTQFANLEKRLDVSKIIKLIKLINLI